MAFGGDPLLCVIDIYIYTYIYVIYIYIYKCLCTDCVRVVWPVEDLLQYVYSPVQFV